jgi:PPOX class probable F420-dependent enzyme
VWAGPDVRALKAIRERDTRLAANQRAQIVMTPQEVADFLRRSRTASVASLGPGGLPHVVAMWYGLIGDAVYIETKAKSQKAVNLRRDPRMVFMVEAGTSYDTLRGVSLEGSAVIISESDGQEYWDAAISVYERYTGPYTEEARPLVEFMMNKRIVAKLVPDRIRSWDHRKLGLDAIPTGGSTASFIGAE